MEILPHSIGNNPTPVCDKRRKGDNVGEDYISEISDDILVNILSRLTIKEAARASILSSRWRYLWNCFTGCLYFDNPITMQDLKSHDLMYLKSEPLEVERHKFVSWVNRVLGSLQSQSLEELRICFDVDSNDDIGNWIKFAAAKKVRKLKLDFSRVQFDFSGSVWQYTFQSRLDGYYSGLRSLTALSLANVGVLGEVIEHILSSCPLLEVLSVNDSKSLTSLKVSGPSLKLKYIKLDYLPALKDLEIDAPNLISFEYSRTITPVSFKNVSNLTELRFGYGCGHYFFGEISSLFIQLRTIKLDLGLLYLYDPLRYNIPELCNLKHLEIKTGSPYDNNLVLCFAFLKAYPSLYKFTLKSSLKPSTRSRSTLKGNPELRFMKLSVRVVEMVGFNGCTSDVEFIKYMIESAKLLEKIIIDPAQPIWLGNPMELLDRETEEYKSARKLAIQLAAKFPLWQFVIP